MKCLVLANEYPPAKGGIGNAAATFAKEMADRGWNIDICTTHLPDIPDEEVAGNGTIHRLNLHGDVSIWNPLGGEVARFAQILLDCKPDVVVIHGWPAWCVLLVPQLHDARIPVILQSHGFGFHRIDWNPIPPFGLKVWAGYQPFIWQMPRFITRLHALVVLSKQPDFKLSFDHWLGEKLHSHKVITIPNGVAKVHGSKEDFLEICPQARGKKIILCIANYCDRKNQLLGLEIAALMSRDDVFFIFIGAEENDYTARMRAKLGEYDLAARVALFTGLSRAMTESAIVACDLALMTSKWEMQPLFLLEAMSSGKPWVSTHVGSVKELQGGLIAARDSAAMAEKVGMLLDDTELASRSSSAGSTQWLAEYEPSVVYRQWEALLLAAIPGQEPRNPEPSLS